MKQAQFRPCIDLHEGRVKQIVGSTLSDAGPGPETNFVAEEGPEYYARLYRRDNLTGGHVVMLGPGNTDAALRALAAWPGGLQLGGGITPENAAFFLDRGAEKLIVTSYLFDCGELSAQRLDTIVKAVGRDKLVIDLSCRRRGDDYFVVTDRWTRFTQTKINRETLDFLARHCSEFLIHAVDVEGKQAGPDQTLLERLALDSPLDCVYAGGIRSLDEIQLIQQTGQGRIHYTIGSALSLFGGPLPYDLVRGLAAPAHPGKEGKTF